MKKKILSFAVIAMLIASLFTLTGCASKDEENEDNEVSESKEIENTEESTYGTGDSVIENAAEKMDEMEKELYNTIVKNYTTQETIRGVEVKVLIESIISQNETFVNESGKFISIHAKNISEYDDSGLEGADMVANVYENKNGENSQENIDEAHKEFRNLSEKISTTKEYHIEERESNGLIYAITIEEVN